MADPGRRRDDAEVVERLLAPAQEGVALAVALVVAVGVDVEGPGVAEGVDLDRVIDHQVDRHERVDLRRVGAELVDRVAHRREVDDRRHAGEVLHQHPGGLERDLVGRLGVRVPGGDRLDVRGGHRVAVLESQRVLEQDLERVRQARDVELLLQRVEPVDLVFASGDAQRGLGGEGVAHDSSIPTAAGSSRRSAQRLSVCPRGDLVGDLGRGARRPPARKLGRVRGDRRQRPGPQRRHRDLAAVALDRAHDTPAPTSAGARGARERRRRGLGRRRTCPRRGSSRASPPRPRPRSRAGPPAGRGRSRGGRTWSRSTARRGRSPPCPTARRRTPCGPSHAPSTPGRARAPSGSATRG